MRPAASGYAGRSAYKGYDMRFQGAAGMTGRAGSAVGRQSAPSVTDNAAAKPAQGLRRTPRKPARALVPNGKAGSWDGYEATGVGAWEWYLASGLLCLDRPLMALLDVDPDTYDGRIETWLSRVHPDDIAWVTA